MAPTPHATPHPEQRPEQSPEQRRAADIIRLLTLYRPLLDAFIIDFFTEDLWAQLPPAWQRALASATPLQLAGLLGGSGGPGAAWPLSLLAFAAAARALSFPRGCPGGSPRPPCQSSHLHPLLRRHVKPKKQHEIRRLGKLLQRLSQATHCQHVVDIGAGQGHLSRFLAFGLGLSVTAVDSDSRLASLAERFDQELLQELGKSKGPGHKGHPRHRPLTPQAPRHVAGRLDPGAPWGQFLLPPDPPGPGPAAQNPLGGPGGSEDGGRVLVTGLHACGDLSPALLHHFARSAAVAAGLGGLLLHEAVNRPAAPRLPLGLPPERLGGRVAGPRAVVPGAGGRVPRGGGVRGAAARGWCPPARPLLPRRAREPHPRRRPEKRHLGLQPGRKAHTLSFPQ
uniref:Ribosomal RNA adenine dimethylase domain containing 1 n=1 Tax=Malurus cyaneus samueli TaxID=2593467 RepID=A0A8C5TNL1_9PASS